jgi:nucleotide-binding universal stress UspA family protein
MTVTTITSHIAPGAGLAAGLVAPLALAEAFSARLTALVFHAEPPADDDPGPAQLAIATLREAAERRGIVCEIRDRGSIAAGISEALAEHIRVSDLGVLTMTGAPGSGARMMASSAVFATGRPVLLVPAAAPLAAMPRRVVVAWDESPAAVRAVHGALPFISRAEETLVVSVSDDKGLRPGGSGAELTRLLSRHGARATFISAPRGSSVLAALEGLAAQHEATLLVMGAVRHAPLRDLILGGATRDLMDRGPTLPTLLAA